MNTCKSKCILEIKPRAVPVGSIELWVDGRVHACPVCGLCEKLLIHTVLQAVWNTTWGQKKHSRVTHRQSSNF